MRWFWKAFVIVAAIGAVILSFAARGRTTMADIKKSLRAIDEAAKAKKLQAQLGHERAVQKIKDDHKGELDALDERQRAEAESLAHDPVALARYLAERASG